MALATTNRNVTRPLHSVGRYFVYKMLFLVCYTGLLSLFMDGWTYAWYKWVTGVVVQAIVRWYTWRPSCRSERLHVLYCCVTDSLSSCLNMFIYPLYFTGWKYGAIVTIGLLYALAVEYTEYTLFDKGTGSSGDHYVIKSNAEHGVGGPRDAFIFVMLSASYAAAGWYVDVYSSSRWCMASWYTPLLWLFIMTFYDGLLGMTHWATHRDNKLWNKHKIHHEYSSLDLNLFASGYFEFSEALVQGMGDIITLGITVACGGAAHHALIDLGSARVCAHHKYVQRHAHLQYFWEYDCLDVLFSRERVSEYHWSHHTYGSRRFSVFGFVPDHCYPTYGGAHAIQAVKLLTRTKDTQEHTNTTTTTQEHINNNPPTIVKKRGSLQAHLTRQAVQWQG